MVSVSKDMTCYLSVQIYSLNISPAAKSMNIAPRPLHIHLLGLASWSWMTMTSLFVARGCVQLQTGDNDTVDLKECLVIQNIFLGLLEAKGLSQHGCSRVSQLSPQLC